MEVSYDALAGGGVEVACGLVGEDDGWAVEQGAGYHEALLFAPRELVGHLVVLVEHPHASQHLLDALGYGRAVAPTSGSEHEAKVLFGTPAGKEAEVLEYYAELTAQVGYLSPPYGVEVIVEHPCLARGYGYLGVDGFQEARFAAANLAYEVDKLSGLDPQRRVFEGYEGTPAQLHVLEVYDGIGHGGY